jgi:hypothetical protein
LQHVLRDDVHAQALAFQLRARAEQAIHEIAQAIRLADHDARVVAQRPFRQLALEQLRGAANAAERIFYLVRNAAYDGARGLLGVLQVLLAADTQEAVHGLQLHQEFQVRHAAQGCDHHVGLRRVPVAHFQGQAPPHDGATLAAGLVEGAAPRQGRG